MADDPSSYLVLASQRSGSTLLVESLRSTGLAGKPEEFFQFQPWTSRAPQPREWFAELDDESILRLLDPFDPGTPDLAPAQIWRDYVRTVGRTPNGVWGGKLMWNQTPLLLNRAKDLPDRSGDGLRAAICDVIGEEPIFVHVHRPDVVSQAVSFWRAVQTKVWRGKPEPVRDAHVQYHAGAIAHLVQLLRAQEEGGVDGSPRRTSRPSRSPTRCCAAISPASRVRSWRRWVSIRNWRPVRLWNDKPTIVPTSGRIAIGTMPRSKGSRPDRPMTTAVMCRHRQIFAVNVCAT